MDNTSFTSAVERAKAIAQRFAESAGVSAGPTAVPTPTSNPAANPTSNKRPAEDDDDFVNKRISSDIASKIQDFRNAFNSGSLGPSGGNGSGPTGSNGSSNSAGPTVPKLGEGPPLLSGMICNGEKHLDMLIPGNKIGLVIGKGGENIRNLQDKAGVRMTIFQQSHDASEPEKLLRISGPPDKVDRGRELVLEVTEREPRSNNSFGGGGGNSGPPGGYSDYGPRPGGGGGNRPGLGSGGMGGRSNDGNTIEVSVPPAFIGLVIGKGGESIKRIQHESGAKVQFDTNKTDSRGNKICAISGSDHSVKRAEDMIQEIIDNAVATRGNGGGGGGGGGGGNRSNERSGGPSMNPFDGPAETVRYPVPSNRCGAVIGRGGETIRQIKQQSGCDIELDKVSKAMGGDEKIFIIRGPSDRIALAKQLINEKVGKGGNASPAPDLPPGALGTSSGDYSWSNYWQAEHGIPPSAEANPMLAASQVAGGASGSAGDNSSWDAYYAQYFSQLAAAGGAPNSANANGSNANDAAAAGAGGQDYTQQWIEYYRAYGMHKEAEQIEQMAKARKSSGGPSDHSKNQQASLPSSVTQTVAYPGFNYSSYTQQK